MGAISNQIIKLKNTLSFDLLIVVFGFVIIITAAWPGWMSNDSIVQLRQGTSSLFDTWHPPFMSIILGFLFKLTGTPGSFLVLQLLLWWTGCYFIISTLKGIPKYLAILFFFCPPIITFLGVIWKDIFSASLFLFGIGIYLRFKNKYLSALSILLACFARPASAPISIFLWQLILYKDKSTSFFSMIKYFLLSLTTLVLLVSGGSMVINKMIHAKEHFPFQYVLVFDLVGMSAHVNKCLLEQLPLETNENYNCEKLMQRYDPRAGDFIFYLETPPPVKITTDIMVYTALKHRWLESIKKYPLAYLSHRFDVFKKLFRIGGEPTWYNFQTIIPNEFNLKYTANSGADLIKKYIELTQNSIFFYGVFWVLLSLFTLVMSVVLISVGKLNLLLLKLPILISLGSLAYFITYFITAPAWDFRYLITGITFSGLGFIFLVSSLFETKSDYISN